jgi:hypothetical protein
MAQDKKPTDQTDNKPTPALPDPEHELNPDAYRAPNEPAPVEPISPAEPDKPGDSDGK